MADICTGMIGGIARIRESIANTAGCGSRLDQNTVSKIITFTIIIYILL